MNTSSARSEVFLKHILFVLLTIGMIFFGEPAEGQNELPDVPRSGPTASNIVSVNQLLISDRTLRSVSRARKFLADGKLDKAQAEISKALRESPGCALALDTQGAIHLHTRDFDAAALEFQAAIDADPTLGQAYVGLGMLLIARSRFKEALIPLDRAQALLPTSWLVAFETAIADLELGDFKGSLKQLDMTEKLAGSSVDRKSGISLLRGLALMRQGDYGGATRNLQDAIRFEPAGSYAKLAQTKIEEMKPFLDLETCALASNQYP